MTSSLEPTAFVPGIPGPALGRLGDMPRVNLMPPEIAERVELQRLKGACAAALVVSSLVVAGLYYQGQGAINSANSDLNAAQTQQTSEQAAVNRLAPVAQAYAQVAVAKATVAEALGGEIRWASKLNDLSLSIPAGVWLTNMGLSSGAGSAGALVSSGVAVLTFQGMAASRDQVATWLDSLVTEHGYANPYVSSTQEVVVGERVLISFTSTVTVTTAALSGRYTAQTGS